MFRGPAMILISALSAAVFGPAALGQSAPPAGAAASTEQPADGEGIDALIADLAASDFAARELARRRIATLADDEAAGPAVRRRIVEAASQTADYETRLILKSLEREFPANDRAQRVSAEQIDAWLRELGASAFAVRDGATERLLAAAADPQSVTLVLERSQLFLASRPKSIDAVKRGMQVWRAAWSNWLTTTDAPPLPAVDDDAIRAAVDRAAAPLTYADLQVAPEARGHAVAERQLLLLLVRDDTGPRTIAALTERLRDDDLPLDAAARLSAIHEWSRPAMVVEFWREGRLYQMQHLNVGEPYHGSGAPNPSHFDRCDDRTAHCVSGNAFKPGEWPVGVFMPHPTDPFSDVIFHIQNLPTARRRLAYDYEVPVRSTELAAADTDAARRTQITRRTMTYFLQRKSREVGSGRTQILSDAEIAMLRFLDADEVSKAAGRYLASADDVRVPHESPTAFGNGSSHGMFCYLISLMGTSSAGPGLAVAVDQGYVLDPVEETPYRMDWVSAFVLAERAPWPGLDDWLAKNIDRTEAVSIADPEAADVGASCAALLLRRHATSTSAFGLEQNEFDELTDLENPGYRFIKPEGREAVKEWWREHKAMAARTTAP